MSGDLLGTADLILGMEQRAYLLGRSELTRGRAAAEREVAHVG
jgi:hypothetical protein